MKAIIKTIGLIAVFSAIWLLMTACEEEEDVDPLHNKWLGSNKKVEAWAWANEEGGMALRFYLYANKYNTVQSYEYDGKIWKDDHSNVFYYTTKGKTLTIYAWNPWNYNSGFEEDKFDPSLPYEVKAVYTYSISGKTLKLTGKDGHEEETKVITLTKTTIDVPNSPD
jgi:hypothetical protein